MSISSSEDGSVSNFENHCEFEGDQQVVLKKDDQVEMMMINQFHESKSFSPTSTTATNNTKKKRNLPGNPDPNSEVIALSPKTLMAKNRFVCEICNKGFQRDQNLQLHRRGHNLPWKLKLRASNELNRKKVYVCPEPSCVHHNPCRALGDLTGIKKHFSRKHGEKKWKCDKCSKKYAVQSDWKAHSKTCGSREYKCDCGTIFSRRDSFITHRAFCDALVSEVNKNRANQQDNGDQQASHMIEEPRLSIESSQLQCHDLLLSQLVPLMDSSTNQNSSKSGKLSIFPSRTNNGISNNVSSSSAAATATKNIFEAKLGLDQLISSPRSSLHYSATALLQKAAQMGAAVSTSTSNATSTSIMAPSSFGSHGLLMSQMNQPLEGTMSDHHFFDVNMGSGAFNWLFGSQDDQKYNNIEFLKDVKNLSNNVCSSSTNGDHHEGFLHCGNSNGGSMTLDLLRNEGVSYHDSESFRDTGS